jgi:hypothetical protein
MATSTTVTNPSITVPGFLADTCASVAPGCRACVHCCKQAFGDDMAAVELCKASFCNTQRIISTRCALRTTLCTAARHAVHCCAAVLRGVPCLTLRTRPPWPLQHGLVPGGDHLRDCHLMGLSACGPIRSCCPRLFPPRAHVNNTTRTHALLSLERVRVQRASAGDGVPCGAVAHHIVHARRAVHAGRS